VSFYKAEIEDLLILVRKGKNLREGLTARHIPEKPPQRHGSQR
jgi:hypothetical protein